jgi:hypothetical protein
VNLSSVFYDHKLVCIRTSLVWEPVYDYHLLSPLIHPQETLFLTIGILDRYLQEKVHHIGRKHLQVAAMIRQTMVITQLINSN